VNTSATMYKRVLLKLSGEALMGNSQDAIEPATISSFAKQIANVHQSGVQIGLVIGGGNIFRGAGLAEAGMDRVAGDHMGMLATVINAIAMQGALEGMGVNAEVMSAFKIGTLCEEFSKRKAIANLEQDRVMIFAAGTGNPFFTTDSAASLRAIEIQADLMLKATKVDGVFDADPMKVPNASKFDRISYDTAIEKKLNVMDATALVLCRDHSMPLRVFNIYKEGALEAVIQGQDIGTLVHSGEGT